MPATPAFVFARFGDIDIEFQALADYVKLNMPDFVMAVAEDQLIRREAAQMGLSVSSGELQQAADTARRGAELDGAAATKNWLNSRGLSVETWESALEGHLLRSKLKDKVTANKTEPFFAANPNDYHFAHLSHIVVADRNLADELRAQLRDKDVDFEDTAHKHSLDGRSRDAGGFIGTYNRSSLLPEVGDLVFGAKAGDILDPVKGSGGWEIIRVGWFTKLPFTDVLRAQIAERIFQNWLHERLGAGPLVFAV